MIVGSTTLVLSVINNKGGTGKTTTSVNLAAGAAHLGRKVLLVDMDPQGNSTTGLGFDKGHLHQTVYHLLRGQATQNEVTRDTKFKDLDLIPSNLDLSGAEVELASEPGREYVLREALKQATETYDHIIIDCPPNIGLLTLNALVASDFLLIPVQCEFYPMEGLPTLMKVVDLVKARLQVTLDYRIVLTMFDGRTRLSRHVRDEITSRFDGRVMKTVIPRSIRIAEAPSRGVPGIFYRPNNPAAQAYLELAREFLRLERLAEVHA